VTRIDCSDVAATQGDAGETHFSHQYYRLAPRVIADVVQVIAGKPPNQISGRLPIPAVRKAGVPSSCRSIQRPARPCGSRSSPATVAALTRAKAGPRGAKRAGKARRRQSAIRVETGEAQRREEGEAAGRRLTPAAAARGSMRLVPVPRRAGLDRERHRQLTAAAGASP
jgi:hypothetical protein